MAKKKRKDDPNAREILNRKARHDYHILDTLEVGVMLVGTEVKAIRGGLCSLQEGYIRAEDTPPALYLHGIHIGEYTHGGSMQHRPTRTRKLLAHKREILKLYQQTMAKGVTLVPLKLYFNDDGRAKILVGVAKGKASHDKREAIKEREVDRDLRRFMSKKM
ncbi:MAG: SsrA-binding protein SmpB [Phycisphaerales bacterium]